MQIFREEKPGKTNIEPPKIMSYNAISNSKPIVTALYREKVSKSVNSAREQIFIFAINN